jgi:DNA-binding MarR family transcriptional regulator
MGPRKLLAGLPELRRDGRKGNFWLWSALECVHYSAEHLDVHALNAIEIFSLFTGWDAVLGMNSVARDLDKKRDEVVLLGILSAVEHDPKVTQRLVASELGIALGLVNSYVKRCVTKGLIKVGEAPARRYAYYLTPKGFAEKSRLTASYLAHSFSFFRRARVQCGDVFLKAVDKGQNRLVLVGNGDLSDVARLVASEHPVEIVATVPATTNATAVRGLINELPQFDAVIVVALEASRDVHKVFVGELGFNRVYAPGLLQIQSNQIDAAAHGGGAS